jgi:hypothetical protein
LNAGFDESRGQNFKQPVGQQLGKKKTATELPEHNGHSKVNQRRHPHPKILLFNNAD